MVYKNRVLLIQTFSTTKKNSNYVNLIFSNVFLTKFEKSYLKVKAAKFFLHIFTLGKAKLMSEKYLSFALKFVVTSAFKVEK